MHQRSVTALVATSLLASTLLVGSSASAFAQAATQKPNILFIMGDDIGWMQPSIYHRGLMVGETPNIDRIGREGAIFIDYVAMQSCTSGRNAFFTGMYPLRTGMIPPQLPGSPSYLRPGTPALAKFLHDLGYTPVSSARTISAITQHRCRPRTASRNTGAISTTSTRCNR
jgi:arylsulfatase